jgi:hypothetical protein
MAAVRLGPCVQFAVAPYPYHTSCSKDPISAWRRRTAQPIVEESRKASPTQQPKRWIELSSSCRSQSLAILWKLVCFDTLSFTNDTTGRHSFLRWTDGNPCTELLSVGERCAPKAMTAARRLYPSSWPDTTIFAGVAAPSTALDCDTIVGLTVIFGDEHSSQPSSTPCSLPLSKFPTVVFSSIPRPTSVPSTTLASKFPTPKGK